MCKLLIYVLLLEVIQIKGDNILKQVLILSRHNLRAPLVIINEDITPKVWPEWKEEAGTLTSKGAALEEDMGEYFASWLFKEKIISTECPDEDVFYVYTNYLQRTVATGEAFVKGAFPHCKMKIHHKENYDLIFNSFLYNNTEALKKILTDDIKSEIQVKQLNKSYNLLEEVLDYTHSKHCKFYNRCNLMVDMDKVNDIRVGLRPKVEGPLEVGYQAIDIFIMQYYNGYPIEQVAWGMLDTHEKRKIIADLYYKYQNMIFSSSVFGKIRFKTPVIEYMADILFSKKPKVTLLVGHDTNIFGVLKGLKFKPYNLLEQYEKIPIGGKVVFQKWYNIDKGEDLLKIEFIYLTSDALRNGTKITFDNPPVRTILEVEGCAIDQSGFCLWNNFVQVLSNVLEI